jgi:hypothetical protein
MKSFAQIAGLERVPFAERAGQRIAAPVVVRGSGVGTIPTVTARAKSNTPHLRQSPPPARSTSADDHDFAHLHGAVFVPPNSLMPALSPAAILASRMSPPQAQSMWARVIAAKRGGAAIPDPRSDASSSALWDRVIAKAQGENQR